MNFAFLPRLAASLLVAGTVVGCGGGGGGGAEPDRDLSVAFAYSSSSLPLFAPLTRSPQLDGLQGNRPQCAVASGSLPPGVSVADECVIAGVPTAVGIFSATISLTVDGFKGSVSAPVTIEVAAPTLAAIGSPPGSDGYSVALGAPLDQVHIVTVGTSNTADYPVFPLQPGDSLQFRITSGAAPPGLTLDSATGTLSGVPGGFGPSTMEITLTVSHGAISFTTPPVAVKIVVIEGPWTLSYAGCCVADQGDSVNVSPVSTFRPVAGATSVFEWVGVPPAGVTLDARTGAIGGWIGTAGMTVAAVVQTVTFPDGSIQSATSPGIVWEVNGPGFNYEAFNLTTFDGQPFAFVPTPITGGEPGDVYAFSLIPTPGFAALPEWLKIDPVTGTVHGIGGTPARFADIADATVVMTTLRKGHSFSTTARMNISIQP